MRPVPYRMSMKLRPVGFHNFLLKLQSLGASESSVRRVLIAKPAD